MLGLIFTAPFLLLLVVFALSNEGTVRLAFWPTDLQLELPLSMAILVGSAIFFMLGALVAWLGSLSQRGRARRAERRVRTLEAENAALKQRAPAPMMRAPGVMSTSTGLQTIDG